MSKVTEAANRIDLFLKDEAVQSALAAMKEQNYMLFVTAKDEAGRAMAQAQAVVLNGFEAMMRGVVDAGQREATEQERRDRAPAARIF